MHRWQFVYDVGLPAAFLLCWLGMVTYIYGNITKVPVENYGLWKVLIHTGSGYGNVTKVLVESSGSWKVQESSDFGPRD